MCRALSDFAVNIDFFLTGLLEYCKSRKIIFQLLNTKSIYLLIIKLQMNVLLR